MSVGIRWLLLVESGIVLLTGIPLFVGSEETNRYFAWTINPPLTAAFFGAAYWASLVLVFLSARERLWAHARIAVPAVLVFSALGLVATLLHLDRFHLTSPEPVARAAAWVWLVIYGVVPPLTLALLVGQARAPGADPPRRAPLPGWMRLVLLLQGAVMLTLGVALIVAPQATMPLWPWMLTPLTGRMVGAWLVGLGVAALQVAWEDDVARVRVAFITYVVLAGLQGLALVRYPGTVDWRGPPTWLYLLFLVSMLAVGLLGWRSAWRAAYRVAAA